MLVPPGGGPPPHRHDFEEMFTILEGEIEFIFRAAKSILRTGEIVNIPANTPHWFRSQSERPALSLFAGRAGRILHGGRHPVATRTTPAPKLDAAAQAAL